MRRLLPALLLLTAAFAPSQAEPLVKHILAR